MKKQLHLISGLPRSGNTLLSNILCQNPRFHATETSGCLDVLFGVRNRWVEQIEHKAHPCPQRLQNVLRAIVDGYYEDIDRPVIFDRSRGWLAYIEFIESILKTPVKILVPMRPVVDILASFENLHRETSKFQQPPNEAENYFQFQTVKGRCQYWMQPDQVVGLSLNRLGDAIRRGHSNRLHFIEFERLTNDPKTKIKEIYNFLGEEYFDHDFDHVEQVTQEDDSVHGFINLHKIKNKVEPIKSKAIEVLGEEVVKCYSNN